MYHSVVSMARLAKFGSAMMRDLVLMGRLGIAMALKSSGIQAQEPQPPVAAFKSSVDLVRVAAVVRDHKGHFVQDLKARDFEIVDDGRTRAIADLQNDVAGVSVAFLFDVSGSMERRMPDAREAATHVLNWLDASRDEAAGFTVDTQLDQRASFTVGL